jgi:ribose 5-phosphate isomerase B
LAGKGGASLKKIAIGCNQNAAGLKKIIKKHLEKLGYEYKDYGSDDPIYANVAIGLAAV